MGVELQNSEDEDNLFAREVLQRLDDVLKNVEELTDEIEGFRGDYKDRDYKYLNEVMVRSIIDIDNVDTGGQEDLKQKRKDAIRFIQSRMAQLDGILAENRRLKELDNSEGAVETTIAVERFSSRGSNMQTQQKRNSSCLYMGVAVLTVLIVFLTLLALLIKLLK